MKYLLLLAICSYALGTHTSSFCAASSASSKEKSLTLTPESLAYFAQSLEFYQSVIVTAKLSTEKGLSGVFHRMFEAGAKKIYTSEEAQKHAVAYWHTVQEDPTYDAMTDQLHRMGTLCCKLEKEELSAAIALAKRIKVLSRKDVEFALLQDECVIKWPKGNLNRLLSAKNNYEDTVKLFEVNTDFDPLDTKVRGCAIAQCYATQRIVSAFPGESRKQMLLKLAS